MAAKIAFFDTKPYDRKSFTSCNEEFGFNIKFFEPRLSEQTCDLAGGYDAVCVFVNDDVNSAVIDRLFELGVKIISLRCAGYNNVDYKAAWQRIHVTRVPAYSPYAIAEHTIALMMTLNRKTHKAYSRTRDGNFSINGLMGFDMNNKTAGIIGTGKIARCLISILKGFGMKVLATDPYPDADYARNAGIEYVGIEELFSRSDIISLHCPLNKETRHLINKDSIAMMKPGVMLINTGRGGLVDTRALIDGLKSKKIGSAGLDVYEEEADYFFEDKSQELIIDDVLARLLTFPNVLVTSHQAFFTAEAISSIAQTTLSNFKEFFDAGWLENEICYRCGGPCRKTEQKRCFVKK